MAGVTGLTQSAAVPADSPRIAEIYLEAMGSDAMLQASFPSAASREDLKQLTKLETLTMISNRSYKIYVTRDTKLLGAPIIAFARWQQFGPPGTSQVPDRPWPEGTDTLMARDWYDRIKELWQSPFGSRPSIRLLDLCIAPSHERQRAGTLLLHEVLKASRTSQLPILALCPPRAAMFFKKAGFDLATQITLDYHNLSNGMPQTYTQLLFTFLPSLGITPFTGKRQRYEFIEVKPV